MATSTTPQGNGQIDEILQETELGEMIAKRKGMFLGLLLAAVIGIIAYGFLGEQKIKNYDSYANKVYAFTEKELKEFKDKKIKPAALMTAFSALALEVEDFPGFSATVLSVSDELRLQDDSPNALKVLEENQSFFSTSAMKFFWTLRMTALLENKGDYQGAIDLYQATLSSGSKLMQDKVYLDLGRLYSLSGNKEKSRTSFEWVVNEGKEEEFKKMARLYLEELGN